MSAFRYIWGVERPNDKLRRHDYNISMAAAAARAEAEQEFENARLSYRARLARIDADIRDEQRQMEIVRLSTPRGRYNHKIALEVAARFGLLGDECPAKRGPGRPPKYGPDDPRPRRPSRAKTRAGRLRAKALRLQQEPGAPRLSAVPPTNAGEEAPPSTPPASAIAERLPNTNHTPGQRACTRPELNHDLAIEDAAPSEPLSLDPGAMAAIHRNLAVRALQQIAADSSPLTRQALTLRSSYLHAHLRQHHVVRQWQRGQDGAKMHDYDFTDPLDETKVKPEVRRVCIGYGLSRHLPTYDKADPDRGMPEKDLRDWMRAAYYNDLDYPSADFEPELKFSGSARYFYFRRRSEFEQKINLERLRINVWPYVERRLSSVEWHAMLLSRGDINRDTARALSAYVDFRLIGRLDVESQGIFRTIVDAMNWFEGFSPSELRKWAQSPDGEPMCRVHQGFPAWAFPSNLQAAFAEGFITDTTPLLDYRPPTEQELIAFAQSDEELLIESQLMLSGADYDDVII